LIQGEYQPTDEEDERIIMKRVKSKVAVRPTPAILLLSRLQHEQN
jgi:hypothetical protein